MAPMNNHTSALDDALAFILPLVLEHKQQQDEPAGRPFFLAISGTQGSGKSTLANALCHVLSTKHKLRAVSVSIDDFYLSRKDLDSISETCPDNKLLSGRGQPGTHDVPLAAETMESLAAINDLTGNQMAIIPRYDKGACNGRGDRLPRSEWTVTKGPVDFVILEGWCVGFQSLPDEKLVKAQARALAETSHQDTPTEPLEGKASIAVLLEHTLEDLRRINRALENYTCGAGITAFTDKVSWDAFIHLDPANLQDVFRWRLEQEHHLRATRGQGMTDEQVENFIKNYMPSYHIYMDGLRNGIVPKGKQLRLILDSLRNVIHTEIVAS